MRYVIANWKMQLTAGESEQLALRIRRGLPKRRGRTKVILCPSHTSLAAVCRSLGGSNLKLGAQDAFWKEAGAFTGEVGLRELRSLGVSAVIVGHSERRRALAETEEEIGKKFFAVAAAGMAPILCVGETASERDQGRKKAVIRRQLLSALRCLGARRPNRLIIAYEPVWAIGTGRVCSPFEAADMHLYIRSLAEKSLSRRWTAGRLAVIYGGSVSPKNIRGLMAQPPIEGVLVGGASLSASSFLGIVRAADAAPAARL